MFISKLKIKLFFLKLASKLHGAQIYFINNADALPKPLSAEEENELLSRIDEDGIRPILIERNLRLCVFIAKKFENTGVALEDLVSIGTIGLIKAINTFCPEKNIKLATYASRCIENEILMYLRKNSGRHEISIDEPLSADRDGNELLLSDILASDDTATQKVEDDEEKKVIRDAIATLDPKERQIIELRYGLSGKDELTQKEVADIMGISQSYISRLEKRIIKRLRDEIAEKI